MNPLKQLWNSVFPVACVCARESKRLIKDVFQKGLFKMDEAASTVLPNPYGILPITLSTNCDMLCDWKLSGRGGAVKQAKFPCAKCTKQSGYSHTQNARQGSLSNIHTIESCE